MNKKHGLPWTGLMKLNPNPKTELLNELAKLWDNIDWGENFEKNRRLPNQTAIYPCTRVVHYHKIKDSREILESIVKEYLYLFDKKMKFFNAEFTLLTPLGFIPWHHDRLINAYHMIRTMIPLKNNENVKYFFSSWKPSALNGINLSKEFMNDDVYECEMEIGNCYFFNHRVPHCTISHSEKPRAMVVIDLVPVDSTFAKSSEDYFPLTQAEISKILPPIL